LISESHAFAAHECRAIHQNSSKFSPQSLDISPPPLGRRIEHEAVGVLALDRMTGSEESTWELAMMNDTHELLPRAQTGIYGLDSILGGGLARNRLHLLEGSPGTGKTTIALQFLLAGQAKGEVGIYVSLAETEQELREGARSHGWEIPSGIEIFELVPPESV